MSFESFRGTFAPVIVREARGTAIFSTELRHTELVSLRTAGADDDLYQMGGGRANASMLLCF